MHRILLINLGSLGDLHPFIGMALILKKAGFEVSLASNPAHVPRIEAAGIKGFGVRPNLDPQDPEIIKVVMTPIRGPEILHRKYIFPASEEAIEDILPLAKNSDLIITGMLGYTIPTVSELSKVPWAMAMLAPIGYWSAIDPPSVPPIPFMRSLKFLGPTFFKIFYRVIFFFSKSWAAPLQKVRKKYGLKEQPNPLLPSTLTSGALNLALFSEHFAPPQADWPRDLKQIGFIEYDGFESEAPLKKELLDFLKGGEAPILLTLGSTNVFEPGKIYDVFYETIISMKKRAIMSVSHRDLTQYRERFKDSQVHVTDYIPYGQIMPQCSVIVHQGGIGTTGQCLRAGKSSVILASVNDQVDNARHVEEIGAGVFLKLNKLNTQKLKDSLEKCLNAQTQENALKIGVLIRNEKTKEKLVKAITDFFNERKKLFIYD